jgi:osmotically-inducible protein OsmY
MTEIASEDLVDEFTAALEREPGVDTREWPVNVHLNQGNLVLEGKLDSIAAKKMALAVARRIAGDEAVEDLLRIKPGEAKGDADLREGVINALLREPALGECTLQVKVDGRLDTVHETHDESGGHIEIDVHDGLVTLSGHVVSLSHLRLAEVLVWWVAGCELVRNELQVMPAEEDNDGEISDAVRIVLEKDPLVHAGQLVPRVRNGTVTLNGFVASNEEKHIAIMDTWYVPGVRNVVDRIVFRG